MGSNSHSDSDHPAEKHPSQRGDLGHNHTVSAPARKRALVQTLIQNVIPRLVNAHSPSPRNQVVHRPPSIVDGQEVLEFAHQVLLADEQALNERLDALRRGGVPHRRILTDLLVPVAEHLGRLWEHDLCDFHDVTLAVGRLQRLLRHPDAESTPGMALGHPPRRVLLSTCRGEQHTFGLSMVAEFFHQSGWDVTIGYLGTDESPIQLAREQWFDMIGLSLGSNSLIKEFSHMIDGLRRFSMNRRVPIIAGGPVFMLHPEYATQFKVDAVLSDASQAPIRAEQLLLRQGRPQPHETAQ